MNERGVFCNHSLQLRTGYVDYLKRIAGVRLNGLAHVIGQYLAIIRVDILWQHQGNVNLAVGRRFTAGNGTEVCRCGTVTYSILHNGRDHRSNFGGRSQLSPEPFMVHLSQKWFRGANDLRVRAPKRSTRARQANSACRMWQRERRDLVCGSRTMDDG